MSEKIKTTIEAIRTTDAAPGRIGGPKLRERRVLAAPGSYVGARLDGLNATLLAELQDLGVVGTNGGLTAHGAAVRAVLDREALDRDFPL
jgi:hypothetical protein